MKSIERETEHEFGKDKQRAMLMPFADILMLTASDLNKMPSPIKEESPKNTKLIPALPIELIYN